MAEEVIPQRYKLEEVLVQGNLFLYHINYFNKLFSNPTNTIDVHGSSTWVNGHPAGNNIGIGWTVHF